MSELLRASIFHTPGNPFREADVLKTACGPSSDLSATPERIYFAIERVRAVTV